MKLHLKFARHQARKKKVSLASKESVLCNQVLPNLKVSIQHYIEFSK